MVRWGPASVGIGRDKNGPNGWRAGCPACDQRLHARAVLARWPRGGSLTSRGNGFGQGHRSGLALSPPSYRDKELGDLGRPLASVLTDRRSDRGSEHTRRCFQIHPETGERGDRAGDVGAAGLPRELPRDSRDAGFGDLAADCAARLCARLAHPQRAPGDWSIEPPAGGCACDLCDTLRVFMEDKSQRTFEWPLAQRRRQHVHSRIDTAELPVTHVTRRQGRPYTLVLKRPRRSSPASRRSGQGTKRIWSGSQHSGMPALDRCNLPNGPGRLIAWICTSVSVSRA